MEIKIETYIIFINGNTNITNICVLLKSTYDLTKYKILEEIFGYFKYDYKCTWKKSIGKSCLGIFGRRVNLKKIHFK
jgi:hypothetical protein